MSSYDAVAQPTPAPHVVIAEYGGPDSDRGAYERAAGMVADDGTIVVVHALDPSINYFGAVSVPARTRHDAATLDAIDHRVRTGLGGHDDEILPGPLSRALLTAARQFGAGAIVVADHRTLADAHTDAEITVASAP